MTMQLLEEQCCCAEEPPTGCCPPCCLITPPIELCCYHPGSFVFLSYSFSMVAQTFECLGGGRCLVVCLPQIYTATYLFSLCNSLGVVWCQVPSDCSQHLVRCLGSSVVRNCAPDCTWEFGISGFCSCTFEFPPFEPDPCCPCLVSGCEDCFVQQEPCECDPAIIFIDQSCTHFLGICIEFYDRNPPHCVCIPHTTVISLQLHGPTCSLDFDDQGNPICVPND